MKRWAVYASECYQGGFIAANWSIDQDLSASLPESWRDFNHQFIPVYLQANPGKSKIAAGLVPRREGWIFVPKDGLAVSA